MTEQGYIDLFHNEHQEGNRPHFKGFIKIDGAKYEFACWPSKNGKAGQYSGRVKPAAEGGDAPRPAPGPAQRPPEIDDAMPF